MKNEFCIFEVAKWLLKPRSSCLNSVFSPLILKTKEILQWFWLGLQSNQYEKGIYKFFLPGMLIIMDWRELLSGKLTLTTSSETLARKSTPSPKPLHVPWRAEKVWRKTNSWARLRRTALAPLRHPSVTPPTIPQLFPLCQLISQGLQPQVCALKQQLQLSMNVMRSTAVVMET